LAELITSKDPSKNHYQGIFAELYRRFGVSSYKNIRLDHYEKVLQFLEEWRQATREK
jgi:ORF6C domain